MVAAKYCQQQLLNEVFMLKWKKKYSIQKIKIRIPIDQFFIVLTQRRLTNCKFRCFFMQRISLCSVDEWLLVTTEYSPPYVQSTNLQHKITFDQRYSSLPRPPH